MSKRNGGLLEREKEETWAQYKRRKVEECQLSAKRLEETLRDKIRNRRVMGPLNMVGPQGGEEERLKEWRMIYDVEERDCGAKKEIGKRKTNKGNY